MRATGSTTTGITLLLGLWTACATPPDPGSAPTRTTETSSSTSTSTSTSTTGFPPAEICNGMDDDGDGLVDDDDPDVDDATRATFFTDRDGDGHGDDEASVRACEAPEGTVGIGGDCDDDDPDRYPDAPDSCDHPDSDCDGLDDPSVLDADGDGVTLCDGDCDDDDASAHPAAREVCDGRDTDCDGLVDQDDDDWEPGSCGWCETPDGVDVAPLHFRTWNPCLLDPETSRHCIIDPSLPPDTHVNGYRLHRVAWREDIPPRRQLFLFLPPANGIETTTVTRFGATAGYRAISLGYANADRMQNACGLLEDPPLDCIDNGRHEILFGEDRSEIVDVGRADSVERRLEVLLAHLHETDPTLGWDTWLTDDGGIHWEQVIVGGWSRGAGNAGYLGAKRSIDGVIFLSGPQDVRPDEDGVWGPTAWVTGDRMTPGCAQFALYHLADDNRMLPETFDLLGLPEAVAHVDDDVPPYGGAQRFTSSVLIPGCDGHQAIGLDRCIHPVLVAPYLHMLCTAGEIDAQTCD